MENNENFVIFTDDDGNELEFEHLDTVKVGEKLYLVCVPALDETAEIEDEDEIEEIIIFEARKDENDGDCFIQVDDEAVLEDVYREFKDRNADLFDFED